MEIQQSPLFASYIQSLHWTVLGKPGEFLYIKHIPFAGAILKIQRVTTLPPMKLLAPIIRMHHIHTIAIEPDSRVKEHDIKKWSTTLPSGIRINTDYFLPTKTIRVHLSPSPDEIFNTFSEAKRRAVRRAQKNNITVTQSSDIQSFVQLKNRAAGFLGSITTFGIDKLWPRFSRDHAAILVAQTPEKKIVGGILLLFWDSIAYYWIAGATKEGKKLFAPTLLVWEALKIAKMRGAKELDFVGVWDERLPDKNQKWKGFTKFKEGFGGKELYYPLQSTK